MEHTLGRMFLIFTLMFVSFSFYLEINSVGLVYSYLARDNELDCYYFAGTSVYKTTQYNGNPYCNVWQDVY